MNAAATNPWTIESAAAALRDALGALTGPGRPEVEHTIHVLDNASEDGTCDAVRHPLAGCESIGIDVVQHDLALGEFWKREDVAEQVAGEDRAPRPDEGHLGHGADRIARNESDPITRVSRPGG